MHCGLCFDKSSKGNTDAQRLCQSGVADTDAAWSMLIFQLKRALLGFRPLTQDNGQVPSLDWQCSSGQWHDAVRVKSCQTRVSGVLL